MNVIALDTGCSRTSTAEVRIRADLWRTSVSIMHSRRGYPSWHTRVRVLHTYVHVYAYVYFRMASCT